MRLLYLLAALGLASAAAPYHDPACNGKQAIVHLFEWKWTDIARECETYLAPMGYCGLQTSVASEHYVGTEEGRPWWERYQPISYKLISRSGNEQEFADMLKRCNAVGVRVYVDIVLNHMAGLGRSGKGIAGTPFDANVNAMSFPGVPYTKQHFNPIDKCSGRDGNIQNWGDVNEVRNCYLVGLTDLNTGDSYVQGKIVEYLNRMISLGAAGFRVDAAKHMWPDQVKAMWSQLSNLKSEHGFPPNTRPFFFQEVIADGSIGGNQYFDMGYVTEFAYGQRLKNGANNIWDFNNIDQGLMPSEHALVFVDNHDTQRGHGSGGGMNYKEGPKYKRAVAFMLAHPYGFARVMSSYDFTGDSQGPPMNGDGSTKDVPIKGDGSCGNGWICEHRWPSIVGMVGFRNAVKGEAIKHWQLEGDVIGFARGPKGFFATSKSGYIDKTMQTGLPAGTYCDVISKCAKKITVDGSGNAQISIADPNEPVVAIHVGYKEGNTPGPVQTQAPPTNGPVGTNPPTQAPVVTEAPVVTRDPVTAPAGYSRTVVMVKAVTRSGQDVFLRGGGANGQMVPIKARDLGSGPHYSNYNTWRVGDSALDWQGGEVGQGRKAIGSPMVWTTNDPSHPGKHELNSMGEHYWVFDVDMDCSSTNNGWFEFKAVMSNAGSGFENAIQQTTCTGNGGGAAPFKSSHGNHIGRCGFKNIVAFGANACTIDNI